MTTAPKKPLAVLALLLLCLALTACGAPEQPALSCAETADKVQAACAFTELNDVSASYLEKQLLIDSADLEDWVMRRDLTGVSPEMILIVKVKPGADQAAILQAVRDYREERILQYRDYQPEQVYKLENSKVMRSGAMIALIVTADAGSAASALGSGWTDR